MAFNLQPVSELARSRGIKILVHGPPGIGKTVLCTTTGHVGCTAMICAEGGLLSIRDVDMHGGEVRTFNEFEESYRFFAYNEGAKDHFQTVCLDSISEIAEICLANEMKQARDPRKAYGELYKKMKAMIRAFRDLPYNVVFTAQQSRQETDAGTKFFPTMPGRKLAGDENWLAHQFDEVFAYRIVEDEQGEPQRLLQTQPDALYDAKDRSGALQFWEQPNLESIYHKILG